MITKNTLIRRARDSYINALDFAHINQMKNFIRYYGEACALCKLATDYFELSEVETEMLESLEEKCLEIYWAVDAEIEQ
jgi:hypothetical protein